MSKIRSLFGVPSTIIIIRGESKRFPRLLAKLNLFSSSSSSHLYRHNLQHPQHITKRYLHRYTATPTSLSNRELVHEFVQKLDTEERKLLLEELIKLYPQENYAPIVGNDVTTDESMKSSFTDNTVTTTTTTTDEEDDDDENMRVPNYAELQALAIAQSLPFIGFGFLDNLIMILAGDYIDLTLGVTFGISTMAAAGLGNALSDIAGIGSAYYVERLADKVGVKSPPLSLAQLQMSSTRWAIQIGRAVGITIGCIVGMFPLLFIPHKNDHLQSEAQEQEVNEISE